MSKRDRFRRRMMIEAIVAKQAYIHSVAVALDDLPPGRYFLRDPFGNHVEVYKHGMVH